MSTQEITSNQTKIIAERWFAALKQGNLDDILSCLDKNILWINNPTEKGLSDIIPWLGEYHGVEAVKQTFIKWGQLSEIQNFELKKLTVDGNEVFAVVREVVKIKATNLIYDIEFLQRFKVLNDKIIFWKIYWDSVKAIVAFRGDMNERLKEAARKNNISEALLVLPFGADPNTRDEQSGQTVLMIAAARGFKDFVELLIKSGADVNIIDKNAGASALHKACQGKHLEVVQVLIKAGAFIDVQTPTTGHTPIVEAIWFKADDIVEYLLNGNARISTLTHYGFTIDDHIKYAKMANRGALGLKALERIELLVNQRREEDRKKENGQHLNKAVIDHDLDAVREALNRGEDVDQRHPIIGGFEDAHTPLLIASRDAYKDKETYIEIIKLLIEAKANVNAVEPTFGAVPLHKATYNGNTEVTDLLVKQKGINLNYQGPSNGYTPLHDALWHAYADCATVLINAGARKDIVAYDGKLPIDIAIEELGKDHPIIQLLS